MPKPRIGTIAHATVIGRVGHERYRWSRCPTCATTRWVVITRKKPPAKQLCKACAIRRFNESRPASKSPMWKGGRRIANGYVLLYLPATHRFASMCVGGLKGRYRRYIAEHRLVVAESIGRPLSRQEIVHHKDGNRANNALDNLELTALGQHSKDHSKGYQHGYAEGYAAGLAAVQKENRP